jgi:hypothetical protein
MKYNLGLSVFLKGVTRDFVHIVDIESFGSPVSHCIFARLWGNRTHVIRVAIRADAKGKVDKP